MDDKICIKTNYPKYKFSEIYTPFLFTKLREYHNGFFWSWLGCIHAVTRHKLGLKAEAENALKNIAKKIIEHKGIFEVYGQHEKPIDSFLYKSEIGFAWSAGLFVWACKEIGLK
jgi:glycogen debranching enzyme